MRGVRTMLLVVVALLGWSGTAHAQALVLRGGWNVARVESGATALARTLRTARMRSLSPAQRAARIWSDGAAWDGEASEFLLAAHAGDIDLKALRILDADLAETLPQILAERTFVAELATRLGSTGAAPSAMARLCDVGAVSGVKFPLAILERALAEPSTMLGAPLHQRILLPGRQSWDSWAVATRSDGLDSLRDAIAARTGVRPAATDEVILRYNLAAPRALPSAERHDVAELVLTASVDGGQTWIDLGTVVRGDLSAAARQPVWSGSTVVREVGGQKEILIFYTEGGNDAGAVQQVRVARSTDGLHYEVDPDPVVRPFHEMGYDTTSQGDGFVKALRDPNVFYNPQTERWEMLVATKWSNGTHAPHAVVGRLYASDDTLRHWRWMPPLEIPAPYDQIEMPNPIYKDGRWQVFVSTIGCRLNPRGCMGGHALEGGAAFRGYEAGTLASPFTPINGGTDKVFGPDIYAITTFERVDGTRQAMGFYPSHMPHPDSGTGLIDVTWDAAGHAHFDLASHLPDGARP